MTKRLHPNGLLIGHLLRQIVAYNLLAFLVLIGRKLQGNDRPIAPQLRSLYALAILFALIVLLRGFWRDRDRLVRRAVRIATNARRRPMLALYLGFWLVVALVYVPTVMFPEIGRGFGTMWSGGSLGYATFAGDNSADVTELFGLLLMAMDIVVSVLCLACLRRDPGLALVRLRLRRLQG